MKKKTQLILDIACLPKKMKKKKKKEKDKRVGDTSTGHSKIQPANSDKYSAETTVEL